LPRNFSSLAAIPGIGCRPLSWSPGSPPEPLTAFNVGPDAAVLGLRFLPIALLLRK